MAITSVSGIAVEGRGIASLMSIVPSSRKHSGEEPDRPPMMFTMYKPSGGLSGCLFLQ